MLGFIKKHSIILLLLLAGSIVGIISYYSTPQTYTYRLIYEYDSNDSEVLNPAFKSDTLVRSDELLMRFAKSSVADTMAAFGLKRSELKLYSDKYLDEDGLSKLFQQRIAKDKVRLIFTRKDGFSRSIISLMSYPMLGLFLGSLIHFLRTLRRKQQ